MLDLVLSALIAVTPCDCTATPTPTPTTQPAVSTTISTIETSVFNQINSYRNSQGLPALQNVSYISQVSREHSANMASGAVTFGHTGFSDRVAKIKIQVPLTSAAENVAYNQGYSDPATQAVQGWLKSSGHLANIRGNYTKTGIGVAVNSQGAYYFTQIFIK